MVTGELSKVFARVAALVASAVFFGGCAATPGSVPAQAEFRPAASPELRQPPGFTTIYNFSGLDGSGPSGPLLIASNGVIYGTTRDGGKSGLGTIFRLTPTSSGYRFKRLHSFGGSDGASPQAGLALLNGMLYGTTFAGGSKGLGTVFRISTSGSSFATMHSFLGGKDGEAPLSTLVWDGAKFIGTTTIGGGAGGCLHGCGTVFSLTSSSEKVLYSFLGGADGTRPNTGVTLGSGGLIYGTTITGGYASGRGSPCVYAAGTTGCGTVFELRPKNGRYSKKTIYPFMPSDIGYWPNSPLLIDGSGHLVGTTEYRADHGGAALYSVDSTTGAATLLYDFDVYPGADKATGQIASSGGAYYGTSLGGGSCCGNVWSIKSGVETALYSFQGKDGAYPLGGVTYFQGSLFGATQSGGTCTSVSGGCGTIYKLPAP